MYWRISPRNPSTVQIVERISSQIPKSSKFGSLWTPISDRVIFVKIKFAVQSSRIQQSVTQAGRHYTTGAALHIK